MQSLDPMDRLFPANPRLFQPGAPVPKIRHHRVQFARCGLIRLTQGLQNLPNQCRLRAHQLHHPPATLGLGNFHAVASRVDFSPNSCNRWQ